MYEKILTTILYLLFFFWGGITYFIFTSTMPNKELKKWAYRLYPSTLYLILLFCMIYYGAGNTKDAIGFIVGEFVYYTILITSFYIVLLLLLLAFLFLPFDGLRDIKFYIKMKIKKWKSK